MYFAASLGSILIVFALQTVTLYILGGLFYDTDLPENTAAVLLLVLLGAIAFTGLGLATAALIRSAEGASAVVNVILLPLAFLSGSFGQRDYPAVLEALANVLPLLHYIDLVSAAALDGDWPWSDPSSVAVVAAWGAAGYAVASRRFTWEPRER